MRRLSLLALLLLPALALAQAPSGTTQLFTDSCNGTQAGSSSSSLGTAYTVIQGTWQDTASGHCYASAAPGSSNPVYRNDQTFSNDQYMCYKKNSAATGWETSSQVGPTVRIPAGTKSGYKVYCTVASGSGSTQTCTTVVLGKVVADTRTTLQTISGLSLTTGGELCVMAVGTTINAWWNGSKIGTDSTDSSIASGNPGLTAFNTFSANPIYYMEGGNYGATPSVSISPAAGSYFLQQTIAITGNLNTCYTTDGSTPTWSSGTTCSNGTFCTGGSCSFSGASSGSQTIKAITTDGTNSANASNAYTIAPSDVSIVTDDFSNYYDSNLASNHVQQYPLDTIPTQGKWKAVGGISGDLGTGDIPNGAIATIRTSGGTGQVSPVTSGNAVAGANGRQFSVFIGRTNFANDQYAAGKLPSGASGSGGVAVRCATNGTKTCYYFYALPGSGTATWELGKVVSGTQTTIASATAQTIASGATIELRILGTQLEPLIAGSQPPGAGSAVYTDTSISSGAAGVSSNTGYLSDWSAGNVGASDATSNNPYTPSNPNYSDSFGSGSWQFGWNWFQAALPYTLAGVNFWASPFSAQLVTGSTYGLGLSLNANGTISYRGGEFGSNHWQKYQIDVDPFNANINNWFAPLQHRTFVPGTSGSAPNCTSAGTTSQCYDSVAYYPGVEVFQKYRNQNSGATPCSGGIKTEYCGTPWLHITKVTPTASPDDSVLTVAGSLYTPRVGDWIYEEYVAPNLNVACKGNSANYVYWQANHSYAAGSYIIDGLGNWQYTASGGTSGGTEPPNTGAGSWGATWDTTTTFNGATTTDNTVTWEYAGQPCPTNTKFSWVIQATDSDLAGAKGIPGLWIGAGVTGGSATPQPVFYSWSAGTATGSTACTMDSNLCTTLEQPHPMMMLGRLRRTWR